MLVTVKFGVCELTDLWICLTGLLIPLKRFWGISFSSQKDAERDICSVNGISPYHSSVCKNEAEMVDRF